jgi:hypothetical protein
VMGRPATPALTQSMARVAELRYDSEVGLRR